jgi:hypothetical protein
MSIKGEGRNTDIIAERYIDIPVNINFAGQQNQVILKKALKKLKSGHESVTDGQTEVNLIIHILICGWGCRRGLMKTSYLRFFFEICMIEQNDN